MRFLLLILGIYTLSLSPVLAEGGLLNAVSFKVIPTGAAVAVRPLDNSDNNLVLQRDFEQTLRKQGFTVSKDAPFVLSFETRDVAGAYTDRPSQRWDDLSSRRGAGEPEKTRTQLRFFDTPSGGLVNRGGQTRDTTVITPTKHRIDATIEDKANGHRHWQAWTIADQTGADRLAVMRSMVPEITLAIGTTVRQRPFAIP